VVAFAFGAPDSIGSNHRIGLIAHKSSVLFGGLPIFTQADVCPPKGTEVFYIDEEAGSPPSTLRVARSAVSWAANMDINDLLVACAKPHVWRCMRDLNHVIDEAGVSMAVWPCEGIYSSPDEVWFCEDSTQARTRSPKIWSLYEGVLSRLPMFVYRRIAS